MHVITDDHRNQPPGIDEREAALEDALPFLKTQAEWLERGLDGADDPLITRTVLARHDASHCSWVGLIAALQTIDPHTAALASALYSYHGRVAGALERGSSANLLPPDVLLEVRSLLRRRLRALTDETIARLEQHGLPASSSPSSGTSA